MKKNTHLTKDMDLFYSSNIEKQSRTYNNFRSLHSFKYFFVYVLLMQITVNTWTHSNVRREEELAAAPPA